MFKVAKETHQKNQAACVSMRKRVRTEVLLSRSLDVAECGGLSRSLLVRNRDSCGLLLSLFLSFTDTLAT